MSRVRTPQEPDIDPAPSRARGGGWSGELTAWLLSGSGIALVAAAVLIPAQHGLGVVLEQRDLALAEETHRRDRLERYERYFEALDQNDRALLVDLAEREFGVLPEGMRVIEAPDLGDRSHRADPFAQLEAPEASTVSTPALAERESVLSRWVMDLGLGRWLIVGGAALIFAGVLTGGSGPSEP